MPEPLTPPAGRRARLVRVGDDPEAVRYVRREDGSVCESNEMLCDLTTGDRIDPDTGEVYADDSPEWRVGPAEVVDAACERLLSEYPEGKDTPTQ